MIVIFNSFEFLRISFHFSFALLHCWNLLRLSIGFHFLISHYVLIFFVLFHFPHVEEGIDGFGYFIEILFECQY